jgi:hypothetical protein
VPLKAASLAEYGNPRPTTGHSLPLPAPGRCIFRIPPIPGFVLSHLDPRPPRETPSKRDSLPFRDSHQQEGSYALFPAPGFVLFFRRAIVLAGPASEKAQKSYKTALEEAPKHRRDLALDGFKKADKQDQDRCLACQKRMIPYGLELHGWKTALAAADEMVAEARVSSILVPLLRSFARLSAPEPGCEVIVIDDTTKPLE